jgi:hypothetical protein
MSTFISKIKEETQQKWQKEWDECTNARITKEIFPKGAGQAKAKNKYKSNTHGYGDGSWKDQGVFAPF